MQSLVKGGIGGLPVQPRAFAEDERLDLRFGRVLHDSLDVARIRGEELRVLGRGHFVAAIAIWTVRGEEKIVHPAQIIGRTGRARLPQPGARVAHSRDRVPPGPRRNQGGLVHERRRHVRPRDRFGMFGTLEPDRATANPVQLVLARRVRELIRPEEPRLPGLRVALLELRQQGVLNVVILRDAINDRERRVDRGELERLAPKRHGFARPPPAREQQRRVGRIVIEKLFLRRARNRRPADDELISRAHVRGHRAPTRAPAAAARH